MLSRLSIALLLSAATVPFAHATGEILSIITEADTDRLERFDEARDKAVDEASQSTDEKAKATFLAAIDAEALPFADFDLTGNWKCRTIKAGGLAELVVYGWFNCRVTDDGSGWRLEKLTGSQRTVGRFFTESDTRQTYLGSFFVAGDSAPPYASGPESDQVGYATRTGSDTWQIAFPFPHYESTFDILQLRR
ncbi:DUF4893 domain-containing protein [Aliihoeflea sp. PC F10.4]